MGVLKCYEPKDVFSFFETVCSIPHGSGNTGAIADYCVEFAKKKGLKWYRDEANNVVIYKPASEGCEDADTLILQGHLDMVCEKKPEVSFDFLKDGIVPVAAGDIIRAEGTTLGGDNGIAVAMMLAILDDDSLVHPPLEILLTSDEEVGMLGAFAFDCSALSGHRLLNLDSEYEGVLMCSCAGGITVASRIPVIRESAVLTPVTIEITGLRSGHSGVEIDKGRANANVLMGRLLHAVSDIGGRIIALEGGVRETAIAPVAKAVVGISKAEVKNIQRTVEEYRNVFCREYAATEPELKVNVAVGQEDTAGALTFESTQMLCKVLLAIPDSVQSMSMDMPGLVQTSTNFGILKLEQDELHFINSVRSSVTSQKYMVCDQIAAIVSLAGGHTETSGDYPGWAYDPNSVLKDVILSAYERITGKEAAVEAVHAGIECGLFADSIENLDCVSIGPEMGDVHTPQEWLSISSTKRTYDLLKTVLEDSSK